MAFTLIFVFSINALADKKPVKAPDDVAGVQQKPGAEELYKVSANDMVIGNSKAKVTVIEYASMTCSHCADFHKSTFPEVKEKYIDTGKIRFVFRSFPFDEPALRASMLAYCSGNERFFKFIDVMFTTQPSWVSSKNYLEILANIGKLGGVSGEEFDSCMKNKELETKIMQGKLDAANILGVRSTPLFFINGVVYKGAHGFEYFSKILDEALAGKQ